MATNLDLAKENCTCYEQWHRCFKDSSPSMSTLRRAFTLLARWAFSSKKNMADYGDILECYTYDATSDSNKLSINPGSVVDPGDAQNVPGILVSIPEGIKYNKVAMQPEIHISPDTSTTTQVALAEAQIVFLIRDYDADICSYMGDLIALFLFAMRTRLFNTWNWLSDFDLEMQTEPKITTKDETEATQWYESKVVFKLVFNYSVFVGRESKRLKDYTLYTKYDFPKDVKPARY